MDLVNTTAVPARLMVARLLGVTQRIGLVVAKATFSLGPGGPELDTQAPLGLFDGDQETPLGLLPRDDLPRRDPAFEVFLLGAAHAPRGEPVMQMRVSLAVGSARRELLVTGDRTWEGSPDDGRASQPAPFTRMPLTYARAFGGRAEVEIDREAFVEVTDPRNPEGRGFDPAPMAKALCETLKAPEGYPRFDAARRLPNVEDPDAPVTQWDDAPDPMCWAPLPQGSPLQAERSVTLPDKAGGPAEPALILGEGMFHRAHPRWILGLPDKESLVEMRGLSPDEAPITFRLPALRVLVDYVSGLRSGARELAPHALVLLPEERRFYLVFRHAFSFEYPSAERSMRLRVEHGGWFSPEEG